MSTKPSKVMDLSDVFHPTVIHNDEPPENFGPEDISLAELQELERTLVQSPTARWTTAQRVFFECLLSEPDMDPKKAARKAGIKPGQAKRWLSNPETQSALNHLMTRRVRRVGVDGDRLLRNLYRCFLMATGEKPVLKTYQFEGELYTEEVRHTDLQAAARFGDLLAKHFQLYQPEVETAGGVHITFDMGDGRVINRTLEHDGD